MTIQPKDHWASGDLYENYVGRWSRLVAVEFIKWLAVPQGSLWLDVGCGTGVLSQIILLSASPTKLKGLDQSEGFIAHARETIEDPRASFDVADAQSLPETSDSYDAAASALVLNFVPRPEAMISEMARVVRAGGVVGVYVWDYAGKMEFMRYFWDAAAELDPKVKDLDEALRFSLCNPEPLKELFQGAGLQDVEIAPIEISTIFKDFNDFWEPFLGGQGPAPTYTMSLSEGQRSALRERLRRALPIAKDGSISLVARVWAARGIK